VREAVRAGLAAGFPLCDVVFFACVWRPLVRSGLLARLCVWYVEAAGEDVDHVLCPVHRAWPRGAKL
jgi:hypothetical protein